MKYSWDELDRLNVILQAELEGRPVDRDEAAELAVRLATSCPDIARTMDRVARRMSAA